MQNGYTGDLWSPGNSQPHKAFTCAHPRHGVAGGGIDVHALKSHASENACNLSVESQFSQLSVLGASLATPASHVSGGVLGVTASRGPQGGVLGAVAGVTGGSLPFTGFPLWIAAVIAMTLVVVGIGVRRLARATV